MRSAAQGVLPVAVAHLGRNGTKNSITECSERWTRRDRAGGRSRAEEGRFENVGALWYKSGGRDV